MAKRTPVKQKIRFEIFKRDGFTCQYCGQSTPAIVLELDHIQPVCKGGDNEEDNLITSCFDCNRGKAGNELNQVIPPLLDKIPMMKEKEEQLKEYDKLRRSLKRKFRARIKRVEKVFIGYYPSKVFTDDFFPSVDKFIDLLGLDEVIDNLDKSCSRTQSSDHALNYFCKMCWNQIKGVTGYGQ